MTTHLGPAELTIAHDGTALEIRVDGEVDVANSRDIAEAVQQVNPPAFEQVRIDLSGVTYLDSAGLSMLVQLARQLRTGRGRMTCHAPTGSTARRIIELTGLEAVLDLADDGGSARPSGS